jgi:hypothetical protein
MSMNIYPHFTPVENWIFYLTVVIGPFMGLWIVSRLDRRNRDPQQT